MTTSELTPKDQVCILVVDDHPNTAATLARALAQLGSSVDLTSAVNGDVLIGVSKPAYLGKICARKGTLAYLIKTP